MKTQKAAATAKKSARKEIKVRPATLESLGFIATGEHVSKLKEPALKRIGKFLHKHGLIQDAGEWWFSDLKFRFRCSGRNYCLHAEAFDVVSGAWRVRFTRGRDELEQFMSKRPEGHPERTLVISVTLTEEEMQVAMRHANRLGIDNFEDYANQILRENYEAERFAKRLGAAIGDRLIEKLEARKGGGTK